MSKWCSYLFGAVVFAFPGALMACPNSNLSGEPIGPFSEAPFGPKTFSVNAGGPFELSSSCPGHIRLMRSDKGDGWFAQEPHFSLQTPDEDNYHMEIYAVSACDTSILIHTAADNFYYDDNDYADVYPYLSLTNPKPGTIDIWVGTQFRGSCEAILTVEITVLRKDWNIISTFNWKFDQ